MRIPALAALILMVILGSGCARSERKLPIPRDMLPDVLVAVYVAEAEASVNGASVAGARLEALRSFGYDTTDFNETVRMLTEDPETGKEVYQAVLDSVIFEQREIRSKLLADSVRHDNR